MTKDTQVRFFWEIVPGTRCNLTCKNCYAAENARPDRRELNWEQMQIALEQACDLGMKEIDILGGEPLLYTSLDKFIKLFKKKVPKGFCGIVSNGTLMTRERAKSLLDAGLDQVTISMDGTNASVNDSNRGFGTFDRALKGILNTQSENIPVTISYTVTPFNTYDTPNLFPFTKSIGAVALGVQITEMVGRANKTLTSFGRFNRLEGLRAITRMYTHRPTVYTEISTRSLFKGFLNHFFNAGLENIPIRCSGGIKNYMVSSGGDFFPCSQYAYSPTGEVIHKGVNLVTTKPSEIMAYAKNNYQKFNQEMASLELNNFTSCRKCVYNTQCAPCPLLNPKGDVPECEWVKHQNAILDDIVLNSQISLLMKPRGLEDGKISFDVETQKQPVTLLMSEHVFKNLVNLKKVSSVVRYIRESESRGTKTQDKVVKLLCQLHSHKIINIDGLGSWLSSLLHDENSIVSK